MIDENTLPQVPVNQPDIQEIPKKKNILIPYLLSLILVALVSGGGVYFWQKSVVPKSEVVLDQNKPVYINPTPTTVLENIPAGWKNYRDEGYGISINYPSSWIIKTEDYFCPRTGRCVYLDPKEIIDDPNRIVFYGEKTALVDIYRNPLESCSPKQDKTKPIIIGENVFFESWESPSHLVSSDCKTRLYIDLKNALAKSIVETLKITPEKITYISGEKAKSLIENLPEVIEEKRYQKTKGYLAVPICESSGFGCYRYKLTKVKDGESIPIISFYVDPVSGEIFVEDLEPGMGESLLKYIEWKKVCQLESCLK